MQNLSWQDLPSIADPLVSRALTALAAWNRRRHILTRDQRAEQFLKHARRTT